MINKLLTLNKTDSGFVAAHHYTNPSGSLFGGQVLAQSLMAASQTIDTDARFLHSLHAYFVNRGDGLSPVNYHVNTLRTGRSFTAINTVAKQNNTDIFIASMSFQRQEDNGVNHVFSSATVPVPNEEDMTRMAHDLKAADTDPKVRLFTSHRQTAYDIVTTRENPLLLYQDGSARSEFWIKIKAPLAANDVVKNQACLLMASDMGILFSTIAPYQVDMKKTQFASIDHSFWLHNPAINMNNWHLIQAQSTWAGNSRSLVKADIFNQHGNLVASVAQEGLIRTQLIE